MIHEHHQIVITGKPNEVLLQLYNCQYKTKISRSGIKKEKGTKI